MPYQTRWISFIFITLSHARDEDHVKITDKKTPLVHLTTHALKEE